MAKKPPAADAAPEEQDEQEKPAKKAKVSLDERVETLENENRELKGRIGEAIGDLHRLGALLGKQFGPTFEAQVKSILLEHQGAKVK